MTGSLTIDRGSTGEKYFGFMSGNGTTLSTRWVDDPNNTFWVDATNNQIYMQYRKADKMFLVNSDTNLLKKTGDTATGEMTFRHNIQQQSSDGKTGIVSVINLSQTKWAVGPRVEGTVDWSKELSMSLITGEVSVAALKVKGERALTISDAEEKLHLEVEKMRMVFSQLTRKRKKTESFGNDLFYLVLMQMEITLFVPLPIIKME